MLTKCQHGTAWQRQAGGRGGEEWKTEVERIGDKVGRKEMRWWGKGKAKANMTVEGGGRWRGTADGEERKMERSGRRRGAEDGEGLGMGDLEGKREWAQAGEWEREREGGKGG